MIGPGESNFPTSADEMTPELWSKVMEVFGRARELPRESRAAYVARACAEDPGARRQVESLLSTADDESAQGFMEPPELAAGDRVGGFTIRRKLGKGGMGSVYEAVKEDDELPIRVAIKVIHRGSRGQEFRQRFRLERQILASLNHPSIAKIIDGGTTGDGRPYFAMEYIEGQSIDEYCDNRRLDLRSRIQLFIDACSAVQYAHQNLVVHRDLKPGNILVAGEGQPKLLDFGIAKLLDPTPVSGDETTRSSLTLPGSQPMTLRYASPEQAGGGLVTTASDVYSLGVLLYENLTGHSPYRVDRRDFQALRRAVAEDLPEKLSSVVGITETVARSGEDPQHITPESVGQARNTDGKTLRRRLRGDLDSIVLKALAKEPERRYTSVEKLSEDLRRYLEGLPVSARLDTFVYRSSKFIQRNRFQLIVALSVLAIVLVALFMHRRQERVEKEVVASFAELVEAARDPEVALASGELRSTLERYGDRPEFAQILDGHARSLRDDGELDGAEILHREALAMWRRLGDEEEVALGLNRLATVLMHRGRFDEAREQYEQTLKLREAEYGRQSEDVAVVLNNLTVLYQRSGQLDLAEPLALESLAIRHALDPDSDLEASSYNNLGFLYMLQGKLEQAERSFDEALRIVRANGSEDKIAHIHRNQAALLIQMGRLDEAEELARRALETFYQSHVHWQIADAESVLGECLLARGRVEEAQGLLERSYVAIRDRIGDSSRQALEAKQRLDRAQSLTPPGGAAVSAGGG